jgi:predicted unusual protein kinase regulating ubiquinone biosynthesis (AarF/ABC1/UbiB family)
MFKHIGFVTSSLLTIAWESLKYKVTGSQYQFVKNLADKLIARNIFYVKAFQSLSANINVLEDRSARYLSSFADNVSYTDSEVDHDVIDVLKESGIAFDKETPANAGMVSLVYTGALPTGERVAIKILRKGVQEQLNLCIEQMATLIRVLATVPAFRRLNIEDMFNENKCLMLQQVNYFNEVENINTLQNINTNIDYVQIPRVFDSYTQNNVIVMDLLEGRKLAGLDKDERDNYSYTMALFGIKCLLFDGVYHGDLHQGNILFMGTKDNPILGILDMGIMGTLSRDEQNSFYLFFYSLVRREYTDAAEAIIDALAEPSELVSALPEHDMQSLTRKLEELSKNMIEISKECGVEEVNELNKELGKYGLRLSKSFCKVQLSLAMAEGVNKGLSVEKTFIEQIEIACNRLFPDSMITI